MKNYCNAQVDLNASHEMNLKFVMRFIDISAPSNLHHFTKSTITGQKLNNMSLGGSVSKLTSVVK